MAEYNIQKAVELSKTSAKFRKQYTTEQELVQAGWIVQPKYDGCFARVTIRPLREASFMSSRTDEPVRSCDHIVDELWVNCKKAGIHEATIFGEVWKPGAKFPYISGKFRQHVPATDMQFVAFDMIPHTGDESRLTYLQRYDHLLPIVGYAFCDYCTRTPIIHLSSSSVVAYAQLLKAREDEAYDGAILRDPNSQYTVGTAKMGEIVKVKPVMSLDLEVAASDAFTRETKLGGTLTVLHRAGGPKGPMINTDVGSGLTQAMLGEIARYEGRYVGRIAEIEFLGYTEEGHLREPRFKGWRTDKLQPDV